MYLTYEEYTTMGGTLDEATFNNFEFEAEVFINWITFNRLKNEDTQSDEVKRTVYSLINLLMTKHSILSGSEGNSSDAPAVSMENDGVSVTYSTLSGAELFDKLSVDARNIVLRYLSGVKNSQGKIVTYRGLYEDE